MTSRVASARRLFFDIETVPNKKAVKMLPQPIPPKNYKDGDKIAAWIADKQAEMLDKAALDPDTALIKAIGWRVGPDGVDEINIIKPTMAQERKLLVGFWAAYSQARGATVGYNTIGFDFPVILRRSMELGVGNVMPPDLRPYQVEPTTDLMRIMFGNTGWKGLKWLAYRYGIVDAMPDAEGGDVVNMSDEELAEYLRGDLHMQVELWRLMNDVYFRH